MLLYAGRLAPEKNPKLLVDTASILHDGNFNFRWIVAGDGSSRSWLEKEASERCPGKMIFLGYVAARNYLADLFANCDAFVHPNEREPFGIAPLEAMASGMVTILPNSGGVREYATSANSLLVDGNAETFAAAIRLAASERERAFAIAQQARATAERFSWVRAADSYLELYGSILEAVHGRIPMAVAAPHFISTPASKTVKMVVRIMADLAGACFSKHVG
jgi:alpha-1,6-mannosyltransferase